MQETISVVYAAASLVQPMLLELQTKLKRQQSICLSWPDFLRGRKPSNMAVNMPANSLAGS